MVFACRALGGDTYSTLFDTVLGARDYFWDVVLKCDGSNITLVQALAFAPACWHISSGLLIDVHVPS
eukprot:4669487-Pyramimonas_sp.AAC.1